MGGLFSGGGITILNFFLLLLFGVTFENPYVLITEALQIAGEEEVRHYIEQNAAQASYNADYENTEENITAYWMRLVMFVFVFALLAMITLEFIDKDKR